MGLSFSDTDTLKKVGSSLAILAVLAAIIYGIYYFKNKSSFGEESSSYKETVEAIPIDLIMNFPHIKIIMVVIVAVIAFYFYKKNKGSAFGRRH